MIKRLSIGLMLIMALYFSFFDTYPYEEKIQRLYDKNNPSGNKAICLIVGNISKSMYPYTIHYMEGEFQPLSPKNQEAHLNRLTNENLHLFSQFGLFTEEQVARSWGKPIYRYNLTNLGRQYFDDFNDQTNFCFGRIVVNSANIIEDVLNSDNGNKERKVYITYYVKNVPDWMKDPTVYKRFGYPKEVTTEGLIDGIHRYRILSKRKLESIEGVSLTYKWASSS